MPIAENRLIFKNIDRDGYTNDVNCYLRNDGYKILKKALGMKGPDIVAEVKTSGLRGRGGAGFSCGMKWGFIDPAKNTKPVYLICNADESEPGTFKDKQIIYKDPHQMLEGMAIACFANNVHLAYIYIRGEFTEGAKILEKAIKEAKAKNFLGKNILGTGYELEIYVHRGAVPTSAARKPGSSNRSRASAPTRASSRPTSPPCSDSTCVPPSSTTSRRSAP